MLANKTIVILLSLLVASLLSHAQPSNDNYINATDISGGTWVSGNNTNATRDCSCDITKSICDRSAAACGGSFVHTTNMCCGVEGVESSIWYSFSIPTADTVYIDVRNIVCNPYDIIFGGVTSLQGFVISKVNDTGSWCSPCTDTIWDCFSMSDTNEAEVMMVEATANNNYYIEIDTKKNTFSSCDCANSDPSCHSTCDFQIRIRRANSNLSASQLSLTQVNESVKVEWISPSSEEILIQRVNQQTGEEELICQGPSHSFQYQQKTYSFIDDKLDQPGLYTYSLHTVDNEQRKELASKSIYYSTDHFGKFEVWPNPASTTLNVSFSNDMVPSSMQLYNLAGELMLYQKDNQRQSIDVSGIPSGVYFLHALVNGTRIKRKVMIYR